MPARRRFVIGLAGMLAIAGVLGAARPHVVERWGLYLGTPDAGATAHLFLDPFPSAYSCETRVKVFARNDEHAFCKSRHELEIGIANDAILAADFDPLSPAAWFCLPRWAGRFNVALSAARRRTAPSESRTRR